LVILTLLQKIYGYRKEHTHRILNDVFESLNSTLDVEISLIGKNTRNWIRVEVVGDDTKVVVNYLSRKFGLNLGLKEIRKPVVLTGKIVDSCKVGYGLYVDTGFYASRPIDSLVPLYKLRSHLADGRKLSLRKIIDAFCLYDNFPVSIRITEIDLEQEKLLAEPSDEQIKIFRNWISTKIERVIILGAHLEHITFALKKTGFKHNILKIEEIGLLEYVLLCKLGTNTSKVMRALNRHLQDVSMYVFSPEKITKIIGAELPLIINSHPYW